ncbi:AfsR/SARP family transcriptional regulator [Acrocarpospora pleiomorpha]|uniref:AfsR/SARP family transcriptional regulator n=1 Tax=Acrocarpospora pleiomorpha TaxID=90975 RepID=UPI0014790E10|nr:AfsR/SARP family transcriptional regulator [Acrocarpospora pleiomorpha]
MLIILAIMPGEPVTTETLVNLVWDGDPPDHARDILYTYITRLKNRLRVIGADARLVSRAGTYLLETDPEKVDYHRFRQLRAQALAIAESGDELEAVRLLRMATKLWRGEPLEGLPGSWAERTRKGIEGELIGSAIERVEIELRLARHSEVITELSSLVESYPDQERLVELLMIALYQSGRQIEATAVFQRARENLVAVYGTEPSPQLPLSNPYVALQAKSHYEQLLEFRIRLIDLVYQAHKRNSRDVGDRRPSAQAQQEIEAIQATLATDDAWLETVPLPLVIYLDDETGYERVRQALNAVLETIDQEIVFETPIVRGSIWQAFIAVIRGQASPDRLQGAAGAVRAGLQARVYGEPQSQITKATSDAVANLLQTLQNNENALIAIGDILIVKVDGIPLVRQLTPDQVEHLQKNPRLYTDPKLALSVLDIGLAAADHVGPDDSQRTVLP